MSLTAKESGKNHDPIPEGQHTAVCYGVYDLGTQETKWKDEVKLQHKILICWEIPEERITLERDGKLVDLPRAFLQRYTLSLSKMGNLRPTLEAWRGKAFTAAELEGFDLRKILGTACLLQVVHNTTDRGTYANLSSIMALPKGMKAPKLENQPQWFSLEEGYQRPENCPDGIWSIIEQSEEMQAYLHPEPVNDDVTEDFPDGATSAANDDLPF